MYALSQSQSQTNVQIFQIQVLWIQWMMMITSCRCIAICVLTLRTDLKGKRSSWKVSPSSRAATDYLSLSLQNIMWMLWVFVKLHERSMRQWLLVHGCVQLVEMVLNEHRHVHIFVPPTILFCLLPYWLIPYICVGTYIDDNFIHIRGREAIQATYIHGYELYYNKYLAPCVFKCCGNGFVYKCRITLQKMDSVF